MAFKFLVLACVLAVAKGSYIHGPMAHHYGPSTPGQYGSQDLRYPTNSGSNSQGTTSQEQTESVIRNQGNSQGQLASSQQKTVQISAGSYSSSSQGKSDVRVTNPGTYGNNNYNVSPAAAGAQAHEQHVSYASTPSYSHNNGYEHASASYQQSTPVYGHSNHAATVYGHHSVPVYQYVTSAYGTPTGGSSYSQTGNAYSHGVPSPGNSNNLLGVSYSPAVAVSHMSYSSPVGISYGW